MKKFLMLSACMSIGMCALMAATPARSEWIGNARVPDFASKVDPIAPGAYCSKMSGVFGWVCDQEGDAVDGQPSEPAVKVSLPTKPAPDCGDGDHGGDHHGGHHGPGGHHGGHGGDHGDNGGDGHGGGHHGPGGDHGGGDGGGQADNGGSGGGDGHGGPAGGVGGGDNHGGGGHGGIGGGRGGKGGKGRSDA